MKFSEDRNWGVIQQFELEADTLQAIRGAVTISITQHKRVSHFWVSSVNDNTSEFFGANCLCLFWSENSPCVRLPFELNTIDEITDFIVKWLEKEGKWPDEQPDTDGSVQDGFRIETSYSPFVTFLKITPAWIVYGK